jgi:outer membrane protein assembly factor BamB
MRKYALLFGLMLTVAACDKHDPILPGVRTSIFDSGAGLQMLNTSVSDLPDTAPEYSNQQCDYTIDDSNTIRDSNNRKIFVGFPSSNSMDVQTHPVCNGGYVYAGLNTGSIVKIAPRTRQIVWMADVYSESNMMGGATTVDIVAPIVITGNDLYAGGMGDAFCKINTTNGNKKWCVSIGTMHPFIVLKNVAYVVGLDDCLYAIRLTDGAIYWKTNLKKSGTPTYENKIITVKKQKIDATNGKLL